MDATENPVMCEANSGTCKYRAKYLEPLSGLAMCGTHSRFSLRRIPLTELFDAGVSRGT